MPANPQVVRLDRLARCRARGTGGRDGTVGIGTKVGYLIAKRVTFDVHSRKRPILMSLSRRKYMTRPSTRAERVSKTAALAGAALAFPLSAKADIVYSGIQNIPVVSTGTDPYTVMLDGTTPDFTFDAGS